MKRISLINKTAVVVHPADSDVKITIKRLPKVEWLKHYGGLSDFQTVSIPTDKEGNAFFVKDKEPFVHIQQHFPVELILEALEKVVIGWEGINDSQDNPIPFNKENLPLLLEDFLDFKEEREVEENGKKTMKEFPKAFWEFIYEKAQSNEVFDSDPKV